MMDERPAEAPKQETTDGILRDDGVKAVMFMKETSKLARVPRVTQWDLAWNLYNNYYNFSNKAAWQSRNYLPKVNTAIRGAAYLMKKGITGPRDYFDTVGVGPIGKELEPFVHKLAKYHLERANFVGNYTTALLSGLLSSLVILKVYPRMMEEMDFKPLDTGSDSADPYAPTNPRISDVLGGRRFSKTRKKRLTIVHDPVPAYDMYLDPEGKDLFKIHTIWMDFCEFYEKAEAGKFDIEVAKLLKEDFVKAEEQAKEAYRKGQSIGLSNYEGRKRVQLDEVWGTILDKSSKVFFRNCVGVVVNEKYWASKPKPNPLPNRRDPFVIAPVIEKPFSVWHQGFVESVSGLALMMTELGNMAVDGSLFSSTKAFELDIDQVYDPMEFQQGVHPGKVFKKRGGGFNTAPMIRDIQLGAANPQNLEIMMLLDREFQSSTGLNEFITPQMRARVGRVSAHESAQKAQQAYDFFSEMARVQEEKVLEVDLRKTYEYIVAYQRDFSDPYLVELMGDDAANRAQMYLADGEMRDYLMNSPLRWRAHGMSSIAARMKELDKIMAWINLIGNVSKAVPEILQRVNIEGILKKAVYAFNWKEEEVLKMPGPLPPTMAPGGQGGGTSPLPQGGPPPPPDPVNALRGLAGLSGQLASPQGPRGVL